eukprot:2443944-Amphidinium_carterae.1
MSAEVANKRLTLTGHPGMFSHAGLTGSAWGLFRPTTQPRHAMRLTSRTRALQRSSMTGRLPTQFNLKYTPGGRRQMQLNIKQELKATWASRS